MALIEVSKLSKRFGDGPGGILAVDGVSFSVEAGEVVGFLGPNGAGKSTTMKMITGFLAPTGGTATVAGFNVADKPLEAQKCMGYLPEGAPAYPDMTPESFLKFCASARDLTGAARNDAVQRAVARTNLQGVLHQSIDTLSKGFKRRVGLAQAIMHDPKVLIMDEPTDGLDPNQKHEVRQLIREMARSKGDGNAGKAIILSTHILEEVEAVCTRVIVISRGRVVADCSPAELLSRSRYHHAVTVTLYAPAGSRVREEMMNLAGVRNVEVAEDQHGRDGAAASFTVFPKDAGRAAAVTPDVLNLCQSRGWRVSGVRTEDGRMDEVFRELTSGTRS
ncbi:MAG: ABC transporter ATP-binding protein [Phycisphaerales bacterium]